MGVPGKKANTKRGHRYTRDAMLIHTPHFPREYLEDGRRPCKRRSSAQAMVIAYDVMMELFAIEKIALSAVELPMLMSVIRTVKTRETERALIGMSYVSFACGC